MAENSKIEWTDHTVNLWWGCTRVHAGCDNCYAATLAHRRKPNIELWGNDAPRMIIQSAFTDLAKFQRKAAQANQVHRVFISSMMDIFEKEMPLVNREGAPAIDASDGSPIGNGFLRDELFTNISNGLYPNLIFLMLTKRPSNINKYIPEAWKLNPPENVMFGTSPVDQKTANTLVLQLLAVNGKRFLSCEPMLGPINLDPVLNLTVDERTGKSGSAIDWIICGGESGKGRREFKPEWARDLRDQCKRGDVPFFMKQWDKIKPIPEDLMIREFPYNLKIN